MTGDKKDKLAKIIEKEAKKKLEEAKRRVRVSLDSEITKDKQHCSLIRDCKSFFINLSNNGYINYDIIIREPLLEISLKKPNVSIFDLVAINSKDRIASFVECKTGISVKSALSSFISKIISLREYKNYLERLVGFELNGFEYILCIESINNNDFLQSINAHIKKKKKKLSSLFNDLTEEEIDRIVVWSVLKSENKIVKTYGKHLDPDLGRIMRDPPHFDSISDLDLEYSSHPWRYIEKIIYEKIYVEKYRSKIINPKEFTQKEVIDKLIEEFEDLAVNKSLLKFVAERKALEIINHGLQYGIFEKVSNNKYRIKCRGERVNTVKENLEQKYTENYVEREAEKIAWKIAENEIRKKNKTLSDYDVI